MDTDGIYARDKYLSLRYITERRKRKQRSRLRKKGPNRLRFLELVWDLARRTLDIRISEPKIYQMDEMDVNI
jgi:hypothetical protein